VSVVCQVEVFAWDCTLVQRSPAECGVCDCDREDSIMRRSWPTGGFLRYGRGKNRGEVTGWWSRQHKGSFMICIAYEMLFG